MCIKSPGNPVKIQILVREVWGGEESMLLDGSWEKAMRCPLRCAVYQPPSLGKGLGIFCKIPVEVRHTFRSEDTSPQFNIFPQSEHTCGISPRIKNENAAKYPSSLLIRSLLTPIQSLLPQKESDLCHQLSPTTPQRTPLYLPLVHVPYISLGRYRAPF